MADNKSNTVARDHDYGTVANAIYSQFKLNAQTCFKLKSDNCLANLIDGIENPKIAFVIPSPIDKNSAGYKAAREGVEDAYLEQSLPSPFPAKAPEAKKSLER
jgi:hypothetical protein